MIKIIKKGEVKKDSSPVKQERKPADFWVKESLENIRAQKAAETSRFSRVRHLTN